MNKDLFKNIFVYQFKDILTFIRGFSTALKKWLIEMIYNII